MKQRELNRVLGRNRGLLLSMGLFSVFVNLLMLTVSIFMRQVYDRVLNSRSEETLLAFFLLVATLYATMGFLDFTRGRISARTGANIRAGLDGGVFRRRLIALRKATRNCPILQALK